MSSDWNPRKAGKLPRHAGCEVGYGKPPAESRFKPGQSGNPGGRPKGSRNRKTSPEQEDLRSIFYKEANRRVPIDDGGRRVKIPMAQLVMRSIAVPLRKAARDPSATGFSFRAQ